MISFRENVHGFPRDTIASFNPSRAFLLAVSEFDRPAMSGGVGYPPKSLTRSNSLATRIIYPISFTHSPLNQVALSTSSPT
jgi:hypothetical protein